MKATVQGITYEGSPRGGEIEIVYTVDVTVVGRARQLGSDTEYVDASGSSVGSLIRVGSEWQFRSDSGSRIATAVAVGSGILYRDGDGMPIGEALIVGSGTQYRNDSGAVIGGADTDSMPLRPIPLERYLARKARGASGSTVARTEPAERAPSVCLTYVGWIRWDKLAAQAGMRAGDILIGFTGQDWTVFDSLDASHAVMHARVSEHVGAQKNSEGVEFIVYRPAPGEFGQARGKILKLGPMPAGSRGFYYTTSEYGLSFDRSNSIAYAGQIRELFRKSEPERATVVMPDPGAFPQDPRVVPGAHQDLREAVAGSRAVTAWFWIDDKTGAFLNEREIRERSIPRVKILSYPQASVYVSSSPCPQGGSLHQKGGFTYLA